jgi:hypothetical protein
MFQVPTSILLQENASSVPETLGCMYNVVHGEPKVLKKWDEKLDSCVAEKGTKKLVSSDFAKLLGKEISN